MSGWIWSTSPPDWFWPRLERILAGAGAADTVFFRADDIGRPEARCDRLLDLFRRRRRPLNLAAVPTWLSGLATWCDWDEPLWRWQMHGYRHANQALAGKHSEFGRDRSRQAKRADLEQGIAIHTAFLFEPPVVFTPPWNRCDVETMELCLELGFTAISRIEGEALSPPPGLESRDVCVDLHTRKDSDPGTGWQNLAAEFERGVGRGSCGIMIHHQWMNEAAFIFLERLLDLLPAPE